jgi:Rhs element Vgr protein
MSAVTVTLLSSGNKIDMLYQLVSIDVRREANRIPHASLVLLDGDAATGKFDMSDADYFEPGKEIEIKLRYEDKSESDNATLFKGPVIRQGIEASVEGSLLRIEMKDAAVKLTQTRKSVVFTEKTDAELIGKLIRDGGLQAGTIADTKPAHAQMVQYYATDWDFILTRAEANGLWLLVEDGKVSALKLEAKGEPKRTFDFGMDEIYNLEFEADAGSQYPEVKSTGWDIKEKKSTEPAEAAAFALTQGNFDAKALATKLGFAAYSLTHAVPLAPEELKAWADARMARSRMSLIRGRLATRGRSDVKVSDVIKIGRVGKRFSGNTLVTGICHRVDSEGWRTDIQFGLGARRFSQEDEIRDAPAAGLLPGARGLQIGVVDKFAEDPDKQLRVKVIVPAIDAAKGVVWARLASPEAGKDRGWFFRPEVGDEVVVGFFNDDPRQPVVLGALYGAKNTPPEGFATLSEDNLDKGIVSKAGTKIVFKDAKKASLYFETASKNKVLLDDDKELIEISDKHGNKITLDKDGIKLESAKDLKLKASGNVEIEGAKVDVK